MTQAEGVHSTECPVAPLARDAMKIIPALNRAMERDLAVRRPKDGSAAQQVAVLRERLAALESWASHLKAESAIGAIFQVHLLHDLGESLLSFVPVGDAESREADEVAKAIQRLCYSLRGFLATASHVLPEDAGSEYYMFQSHDPFAAVETAFAERSLSA